MLDGFCRADLGLTLCREVSAGLEISGGRNSLGCVLNPLRGLYRNYIGEYCRGSGFRIYGLGFRDASGKGIFELREYFDTLREPLLNSVLGRLEAQQSGAPGLGLYGLGKGSRRRTPGHVEDLRHFDRTESAWLGLERGSLAFRSLGSGSEDLGVEAWACSFGTYGV